MIKTSYRAFRHINYFIIELIRQFYNEPRCFRICGNSFEYYTNDAIKEKVSESSLAGVEYIRKPIFDISVTSQKSNPFSVTAQNELAKELYSLGLFNPDMAGEAVMCLEMMNFEGKEKIIEKIRSRSSFNPSDEGPELIPDEERGTSEDESYLVKAFKNTFPGQTTLKEARRSARI